MKSPHLIIVGFDEIVSNKYLEIIESSVHNDLISGYSIIDLISQKQEIEARIKNLKIKPQNVFYLPDKRVHGIWADVHDFSPAFEKIGFQNNYNLKVYIAAELKAHEEYLKYCIQHGLNTLIEKPILAPISNFKFKPEKIEELMDSYIKSAKNTGSLVSVMTLSRYHKIYNKIVMESVKNRVLNYEAPVTSYHFRTAGGVWNTHKEYAQREDHPYKYGYGMLMHGAYHYVDLSTQFLQLNKLLNPNSEYSITVSSFGAYPIDQNERISKKYSNLLSDNKPNWCNNKNSNKYGETDITSSFMLKDKTKNKLVTIGTLSFEQTTPSIRTWKNIPNGLYNKNGRISNVNFEVQLSTLHSTCVNCYDVPIKENGNVDRIDAFARVTTRNNASLLKEEEFNTDTTFSGLFHSDSNKELILEWLKGSEKKSTLENHLPVMKLLQVLAMSLKKPGFPVTIDIF